MTVIKNDFGKGKEVQQLPSNMAKGLKTKHWVKGSLKNELVGYTDRNYETLKRVSKNGGPLFGHGRSFTVQVLDKKTIFLEGSASNQYTLKFKTNAEQKDWMAENIVKVDREIKLG